MHKKYTPWSLEEIEAMRRELLEEDQTLQQIGDREGVTRERIRQLVGNLNRGKSRSLAKQQRVVELFKAGKSDEEIAAELKLTTPTVRIYRYRAGISRPHGNKKYSPEHDIWCALKWFELFGYTPAAVDWNRSRARALGHKERAERFEKFRMEYCCSTTTGIQQRHGSWSKFIAKTGLPPAPCGRPGHERYKIQS